MLAADRAALAVASRGALAGALLAAIAPARTAAGVAGLTPTEARTAQLSDAPVLPAVPTSMVAASLGLAAVVILATRDLAVAAGLAPMVCPLCS